MAAGPQAPGRALSWRPAEPEWHPLRLTFAWLSSTVALLLAASLLSGADVNGFSGALLVAAIVAILNAVLPPIVAALRLPFTVFSGFLLVLALDAAMIMLAADIAPGALEVDGFGTALLMSL